MSGGEKTLVFLKKNGCQMLGTAVLSFFLMLGTAVLEMR